MRGRCMQQLLLFECGRRFLFRGFRGRFDDD